MARRYSKKERQEIGEKVARLAARGWSDRAISEKLGINRRTVVSLKEEFSIEKEEGLEVTRSVLGQGHLELVQVLWSAINASGRLMADGSMIPKLSPHQLAVLANSIQTSLKEYAILYGVEAPERLEVSGDFTLRELAIEMDGKSRQERLNGAVIDAEVLDDGSLEPYSVEEARRRRLSVVDGG